MHRSRTRARAALLALAALVVSVGLLPGAAVAVEPTTPTVAEPTQAEPIDPAYVFSVVDVELPSEIRARAEGLLGDRFVDLWVSEDQDTYLLGVHQLDPAEAAPLVAAIASPAPLEVVDRPVSRAELDHFAEEALAAALEEVDTVQSFGLDYEAGVVLLNVSAEERPAVTRALRTRLGSAVRSETEPNRRRGGAHQATHPTPQLVVREGSDVVEEDRYSNPYRAGKRLGVGSTAANCTTSFTVTRGGLRYGMTAGHCGQNGSAVWFGGTQRGSIAHNVYEASNPTVADVALFRMVDDTTPYVFASESVNRAVTGQFSDADLVKGLRVCTRGSRSNRESCGAITETSIETWDGHRTVQNGYRWAWESTGTEGGDSGGPVYRIQSDGSAWAAGVHRSRHPFNPASTFTGIGAVLSSTGATLVTAGSTPPPPPPPPPPPALSVRSDFNGDGNADLLARTSAGALWLYPGTGSAGFGTPTQIGLGWNQFNALVAPGDFNGDGKADLIGRKTDGTLWLYPGNGAGGFGTPTQIGNGWTGFDLLLAPGDFDGDGKPDLIGRTTAGKLLLYRGNGSGGFQPGNTEIGHGWGSFTAVVAPGDFSGDGKPDLIARTSAGLLYLYRGNGSGGFQSGYTQIGKGWAAFTALITPGDFSGDGKPDLIARTSAGQLYLYRGNGSGGFQSGYTQIGHGWAGFTAII